MECIRARAGLIPNWYAATKTYLAIGEADLIFNECYISSYQSRYDLLKTRGEILGSRELFDKFDWATRIKLGKINLPIPNEQNQYEKLLLEKMTLLLSRYVGEDVSIEKGFEIISRETFHPIHRIINLLRNVDNINSWVEILRIDPIFPIWNRAIQVLTNQLVLTDDELINPGVPMGKSFSAFTNITGKFEYSYMN